MILGKKSALICSGLFIFILLGLFTQIFTKTHSDSQSYAVAAKPEKLNPVSKCYDSLYSEPQKILSVRDGKYIYYQVHAQPRNSSQNNETYEKLYFRTTVYRCENLSKDKTDIGRLAFMPKSVAVKFAEQWYKPAFDKCLSSKTDKKQAKQLCIKDFENHVNVSPNTKEESPAFLFTEDAIVFNKFGIRTDKALVVDTYADFEKYMSKIRKPSSQPKK
jgi:hypothetical protein